MRKKSVPATTIRVEAEDSDDDTAAYVELKLLEAVDEGDYGVAQPVLSKCFAIIDKNVKRGIVHKNTAARKKSQLHLKVKKLEVRRRRTTLGWAQRLPCH